MMTKKQRIIAGLVAGCSTLLIIVSAFFLAGPGAGAFPSDLLQTTAPSASQAGQHEGGRADQHASSPDAAADATAGSTAPAAQAPTEGGSAAAPAAGGADGQAASGGGGASTTPPATDPATPPQQPAAPATITVTVNVSSDAVGGGVYASVRPTFNQGATAYDALCATGLSVNAANSQYGIYVSAIGGLAEKDHGASSGWLYAINGSTPGTSCSASVLHDGDTVEWRYVL
ncbi:MAG: DUF4430 domain-containing protein [Eggerthellaceae bacterium]